MRQLVQCVLPMLALGCASWQEVAAAPGAPEARSAPAGPSLSAPAARPTASTGSAHRLAIAAAGCWSGGVWGDALGESPSVDRCSVVLEQAYGAIDKVRLERLRAVEAVEVHELADQLARIARADSVDAGHADALVGLLNAVAGAQHETMLARRAGDRIKKDIAGAREPDKRPTDERDSVAPLTTTTDLQALLRFEVAPFAAEAHAIALTCAADRMQIAKDLPKHIKVYAVQGAYQSVFGVTPPEVPADATRPMKGGAWLAYLSDVARAAGHPVPPEAETLLDKELLAWGGALEGLSDKLRMEAPAIGEDTELRHVVDAFVQRLDTEYRASEAYLLSKRP
jgi:hypothetical protein